MAQTADKQSTVKLTIKLPEPLADYYAERALKHGRSTEDEIVYRLRNCRDHNASQAIYLDDTFRNALSLLAGYPVKTPDDLLRWVKHLTTIEVGGTQIPLADQLIKRLETRRFGQSWEALLERVVTEELERYVGLR